MIRISYIFILLVLFSSCRLVNKNLSKTKVKENTVTNVTTVATESTVATATTAATRTTVEETEEDIFLKGSVTTATGTQNTLDTGGTITHETPDVKIEIAKDPVTGEIKTTVMTKDKTIPVRKKKTTIENVNTVSNTATEKKLDQNTHTETERSSESKVKEISKEPGTNLFWLGAGSVLLFLLTILIVFRKQIFK